MINLNSFKKNSNHVCGILVAFLLSLNAFAEEVKVGVVDMQMAIQSVEDGKKAKGNLEKEFNAKKKKLQDEESSIRKAGEDFKKQSLVLSDDARAKKQGELQERVMRFQELTAKSQMEIQQRQAELTDPIVQKLKSVIAEIAKKKGYTVILEKNENAVLFSLDKDDLTAEAIDGFNKKPGKG